MKRTSLLLALLLVLGACGEPRVLNAEEQNAVFQNAVNNNGWVDVEPEAWGALAIEACESGAWDHEINADLAARWLDDMAMVGRPNADQVPGIIWLNLHVVCHDLVPDKATAPPGSLTGATAPWNYATPSVQLGEGYVWPSAPMEGSPTDLALAFASEVLGWRDATAIEDPEGDDSEPVWVSLQYDDAVDTVKLLTSPTGDLGRVLMQVGTGQAMGMTVGDLDPGTAVVLPSINGAVAAELTLRLIDGDHIVVEATLDDLEAGRIDIPRVENPLQIVVVLIRYIGDQNTLVAAVGGTFH